MAGRYPELPPPPHHQDQLAPWQRPGYQAPQVDDVTLAKLRLLQFAQEHSPKHKFGNNNFIQKHPYALAAAAVAGGMIVMRLTVLGTVVRTAARWGTRIAVTRLIAKLIG
jgi:hypothetical protein